MFISLLGWYKQWPWSSPDNLGFPRCLWCNCIIPRPGNRRSSALSWCPMKWTSSLGLPVNIGGRWVPCCGPLCHWYTYSVWCYVVVWEHNLMHLTLVYLFKSLVNKLGRVHWNFTLNVHLTRTQVVTFWRNAYLELFSCESYFATLTLNSLLSILAQKFLLSRCVKRTPNNRALRVCKILWVGHIAVSSFILFIFLKQ
jgi:hypothetical protein